MDDNSLNKTNRPIELERNFEQHREKDRLVAAAYEHVLPLVKKPLREIPQQHCTSAQCQKAMGA